MSENDLDRFAAHPDDFHFGEGAALQFADDSGHWITIGSVSGANGERHGGTPVKIVGGKIVSGPKRLRGKSIKRLASGKPNHHVEYRRAVRKAVKEHGVKEEHLHDAIEFVHSERKIHHDARETAKEEARKLTGLTAADVSRLSNAGHDYASGKKARGLAGEKLRHFDEFAQELAKSHPELGLGDSDDAAAALWNVLGEGKRSMVAKHDPEVVDEAVRLIHASGGRNYEDADLDAVPFSIEFEGKHPRGQPKNKGEFAKKGATIVSPNERSALNVHQAIKMGATQEVQHRRRLATKVTGEVVQATSHPAIGFWKDDYEPSFVFDLEETNDFDEVKYVGAWQALVLKQKAVLPFRFDDQGPHAFWTASVHGDIKEVAKKVGASLSDLGYTMTEAGGVTLVRFFDAHPDDHKLSLLPRIDDWRKEHGGKISGTYGEGTFIGGENRADSFETYKSLIRNYEKQSRHRNHVTAAWARRLLRERIAGAKLPKLGEQFSISDPPDRDRATSQPAKAKDSAADAANAFSAEMRRRLDKLLKKND